MSKENKITDEEIEKNFSFASSLIKVIAIIIAIMVLVVSKYAFIFFAAAMLPTIIAVFFDRNNHKYLSATICSFNLIGVLPYLVRIWSGSSIDFAAKHILSEINTWMVIYGAVLIGQLLYLSLPMLVIKIHAIKISLRISNLQEHHDSLCEQWGIEDKQKTNKK